MLLIGFNVSLKFDLDIHDSAVLFSQDKETIIPCEASHSPLEAELRHIIGGIESHKAGAAWIAVPDYGAALRGVRWTERAVQAMPIARPH